MNLKQRKNIFVLLVILIVWGAGSVFGEIIYVDVSNTGTHDGETWSTAYDVLQEALDDSEAGDQIWMAKGVYKASSSSGYSFVLEDGVELYGGFEGTEPDTFDLSLRDIDSNPTYLSSEIISGGNNLIVVYADGLTGPAKVDGFIISGDSIATWGIQNNGSSNLTIANCEISDFVLYSSSYGDGVYSNRSMILDNCIIENNEGSGIQITAALPSTIQNCKIRDNGEGGLSLNAKGMIIDNTIHHNWGNGVYFGNSDSSDPPTIRNNTIAYNSGYGISFGGIGSYPEISNCIIWGNTDGELEGMANDEITYCCINEELLVDPNISGNITDDPVFVDVLADYDPNHIDLHIHCSSPCRDAGDPDIVIESGQEDIDGQTRIFNRRVDIGADEFVLYSDIDLDCRVNYVDFAIFANAWLSEPNWNPEYDFDDDGIIDFDDLLIMAGDWNEPNSIADIVDPAESNVDYRDFAEFARTWRGAKMSSSDFDSNKIINMDDLFIMIEEWLFDELL